VTSATKAAYAKVASELAWMATRLKQLADGAATGTSKEGEEIIIRYHLKRMLKPSETVARASLGMSEILDRVK
jgi:hypothetical protein